jgi:hypothetical protein
LCQGKDLGKGTKNVCSIEGLKNTVASIILKWKKFGTTKTLLRAGRLAKQSNQGGRALIREVTKNPIVTLTEFLCGDGRPSKRKTISAVLHQ